MDVYVGDRLPGNCPDVDANVITTRFVAPVQALLNLAKQLVNSHHLVFGQVEKAYGVAPRNDERVTYRDGKGIGDCQGLRVVFEDALWR
jgi:hypothetical protein